MENNENFVEQTENVEQTTEETVAAPAKTFSQEEMNAAVGKAKARERAKVEKQYKREYGELIDVLKAGTGKEDVGAITGAFREYYTKKGVPMRKEPEYTERDLERLAEAEAQEYINAGYEDVVDEVDRLSEIGIEKMTAREKALFMKLANHRQNAERGHELSKIGVTEDVYNSDGFKAFAKKFNPNTPYREIYDLYEKTQPKKEYKTMGSMKDTSAKDNGVKDYYSYEEAVKFTKADFDKNPELYKRVQESMRKWK